jgi:hypothetical protein
MIDSERKTSKGKKFFESTDYEEDEEMNEDDNDDSNNDSLLSSELVWSLPTFTSEEEGEEASSIDHHLEDSVSPYEEEEEDKNHIPFNYEHLYQDFGNSNLNLHIPFIYDNEDLQQQCQPMYYYYNDQVVIPQFYFFQPPSYSDDNNSFSNSNMNNHNLNFNHYTYHYDNNYNNVDDIEYDEKCEEKEDDYVAAVVDEDDGYNISYNNNNDVIETRDVENQSPLPEEKE